MADALDEVRRLLPRAGVHRRTDGADVVWLTVEGGSLVVERVDDEVWRASLSADAEGEGLADVMRELAAQARRLADELEAAAKRGRG